jgi:hypothetical protein
MPPVAASGLPMVRRYEAAGFRAWPAARIHYDGTWVVRLTAAHPAKRLNSVNPLDPRDTARVAERIRTVGAEFDAAGRPLTFRLSPLSGATLDGHLDEAGWSRFSESVVMDAPITPELVRDAMDHIPIKEVGRFMDAVKPVHGLADAEAAGLASVLSSVKANLGLRAGRRPCRPVRGRYSRGRARHGTWPPRHPRRPALGAAQRRAARLVAGRGRQSRCQRPLRLARFPRGVPLPLPPPA